MHSGREPGFVVSKKDELSRALQVLTLKYMQSLVLLYNSTFGFSLTTVRRV